MVRGPCVVVHAHKLRLLPSHSVWSLFSQRHKRPTGNNTDHSLLRPHLPPSAMSQRNATCKHCGKLPCCCYSTETQQPYRLHLSYPQLSTGQSSSLDRSNSTNQVLGAGSYPHHMPPYDAYTYSQQHIFPSPYRWPAALPHASDMQYHDRCASSQPFSVYNSDCSLKSIQHVTAGI